VTREGWVGGTDEKTPETVLATIDFGGRMGVYDFTTNQWHNPLRARRLLIRGSRGEISDNRVLRLIDASTVLESSLEGRQTGWDLNLEGFDLDHISFDGRVHYRNPYQGARFADEEIAIATLLERMGEWCRGTGDEPAPLADACQDQLISLAVKEAVDTGADVSTSIEDWMTG